MVTEKQKRRSPLLELPRTASDEPWLPGLGPTAGGSAATMATGDMVGAQERGPLATDLSSSAFVASPQFQLQRKPRSHVPRAALSQPWGSKNPVLPPAPAKKQRPLPEAIHESEGPPDSPILESTLDVDIYLLKRTSSSSRREKTSRPPPPPTPAPTAAEPAAAVEPPASGNEQDDKPGKCCLHCGSTSTRQWRMGPSGESTLCNPCGVRFRQGRLVPEYRPKASPTFNEAEHSCKHREVLEIRKKQDQPAPAAAYRPVRIKTKKRRKGKGPQPAQACKKRKRNKEQNQSAQALPPPAPAPKLTHPVPVVDNDMEHHLPQPPAQPHTGGELMMGEPLPPPDPFLFEGPAAPRIIDDEDESVVVIVIEDE